MLEDKVKKEKYDWKEWLPIYGLIQIGIDMYRNKPTIIENEDDVFVIWLHHLYQAAFGGIIAGTVLSYL